jgi:hypothetical protein
LLPPGYTGADPEGYFVVRSRAYGNLMFFRSFLKDGDPKPGVDSVKKNLRVYPLSQAAPPEMKFVDIAGKAFNTIGPGNYSLFEYVHAVSRARRSSHLTAIGRLRSHPHSSDAI